MESCRHGGVEAAGKQSERVCATIRMSASGHAGVLPRLLGSGARELPDLRRVDIPALSHRTPRMVRPSLRIETLLLRPMSLSLLAVLVGCSAAPSHDAPAAPANTMPTPVAPPAPPPLPAAPAQAAATTVNGAASGATAPKTSAQLLLAPALEALDAAILQRDPEMWLDVQEVLQLQAEQALAAAMAAEGADAAATAPLLAGARATLAAISMNPDEAFASLRAVEGRIPQTSELLAARLFEEGRPAEAAAVLAAALTRWPDQAPLHQLARTWRDAIPDVTVVLAALDAAPAAAAAGTSGPAGAAIPLTTATRGYLLLSRGIKRAAEGDISDAAAVFERGATEFERVKRDPLADAWELTSRRSDCLINAGWQQYALAQATLADGGLAAAMPALQAAERDFSAALDALPDDPDAINGVNLTGDMYFQGGSPEGIRDYFGRMARRHNRAEWWNNLAFFCRETAQYEDSYAAYQQCIELAPDNARWVNDTGLILLYHLHRDLGHAEDLFRRSIELGKAACSNQFIEADRYAENFEAYTDAMLNLAKLELEQGDIAAARAQCDELIALAPNRPDARQLDAAIRAAGSPSREH